MHPNESAKGWLTPGKASASVAVRSAPLDERVQHPHQAAAPLRRAVEDLDRRGRHHDPLDQLMHLELAETLGQQLVRDAGDARAVLDEPAGVLCPGAQGGALASAPGAQCLLESGSVDPSQERFFIVCIPEPSGAGQ